MIHLQGQKVLNYLKMFIKKVNSNFYIRNKWGFHKIKGIPVAFEGFDLFLHASEGKLAISDAVSGCRISALHKSKKQAIQFLTRIIEKKGEFEVRKAIEKKIKDNKLSPRYRFIVNPKR